MTIRANAEGQSLFVLGAGHGLANVCVRALALSPPLRSDLSKRFTGGQSSFPPYSNERKDWVPLNEQTARHVRDVAAASGAADVMAFAEPIAELGESGALEEVGRATGPRFPPLAATDLWVVGRHEGDPLEARQARD